MLKKSFREFLLKYRFLNSNPEALVAGGKTESGNPHLVSIQIMLMQILCKNILRNIAQSGNSPSEQYQETGGFQFHIQELERKQTSALLTDVDKQGFSSRGFSHLFQSEF